ncbi:MAG: tetratricopeptide repeat protein [Myxococcota bacterium]
MTASGPTGERWLFGPVTDLLLGCGGLYAIVVLAFAIGGGELRAEEASWLGPLLVLLLGAPHYGATLLRVYEHRTSRRAYAIFSVYATLLIVALFVGSLWSGLIASALVTIYLTWSPWHYTGQNYGLAIMFARRRGIAISPVAKRLLYVSFVLSYVLTFLVFHGDTDSAPTPEFASGPRSLFWSIGISTPIARIVFPTVLVAYAGALIGAGWLLVRASSLRDAVPTAAMAVSQALWFSIPIALRHWQLSVGIEPLRWELRDYYFFWIALGHSTQYLWITSYYARGSGDWTGFRNYLGKIFVAGTALWAFPAILLDPGRVGLLPNSGSLALLVASAVNIHHFILDGAIWKLRDSRIASILIRRVPTEAGAISQFDPVRSWQRRCVWAIATAGCVLAFFKYVHQDLLFPRAIASNDFVAARAIMERLSWVNQISNEARAGVDAAEIQYQGFVREYGRRLERRAGLVRPVTHHHDRAQQLAAAGDWEAALEQYRAALELDPENSESFRGAGQALLALGQPELAVEMYEKLVELLPWDERAKRQLMKARKRASRAPPGAY